MTSHDAHNLIREALGALGIVWLLIALGFAYAATRSPRGGRRY